MDTSTDAGSKQIIVGKINLPLVLTNKESWKAADNTTGTKREKTHPLCRAAMGKGKIINKKQHKCVLASYRTRHVAPVGSAPRKQIYIRTNTNDEWGKSVRGKRKKAAHKEKPYYRPHEIATSKWGTEGCCAK